MTQSSHWDDVYRSRGSDKLSWHRPHLDTSLALIARTGLGPATAVIDVGSGTSTLVDDLLARGYQDVSVLDISEAAIHATQKRLGLAAAKVQWWVADITQLRLPERRYQLWHDRAVFHFLITTEQRRAYVQALERALVPGGQVILATFGPEGPEKCSGLPVVRYDAKTLQETLGARFRLLESSLEDHETPWGSRQQFLYCRFACAEAPSA